MIEICQLIIRGQLPPRAASEIPMGELLHAVVTQSAGARIHSNKRLDVKERGTNFFQLFAAEGSGNSTEIHIENVTLCPEGGGITVHEMEGDVILDVGDVGKELSLVFTGRSKNALLVAVAKLLYQQLCDNPKLEGVSNYLQPLNTPQSK